jgi:hypothetical protein
MKAVKRHALETNRTLTDVIEDALRAELTRREPDRVREPGPLPTYGEGGLRPGVDLDDSAALLDLMDDDT